MVSIRKFPCGKCKEKPCMSIYNEDSECWGKPKRKRKPKRNKRH